MFVTIGFVIVAAVALYYKNAQSSASSVGSGPVALAGTFAPSFPVSRLDGGWEELRHYRGKVVLINLWASWCPPCRAEMPDLQRLATRYRTKGVIVLGVDQGESARNAGAFAHSLGITFPILLDEEQRYGREFSALGLPTTIIVKPNGVIALGIDGALTYGQMQEAIVPLLGR
ncbi:MAG: TlpA family protein disulfide reductase [Candidatus Eremiobacteraeota bacterium]|nr:TlpA family protein disulfide reductase [Candidatus Eremiobacteraeota bacterium]